MGSDGGGGSLLKLQRRESLCMRMLPYIIRPDGAIGSTKWLDGRGDDDSFRHAAVSVPIQRPRFASNRRDGARRAPRES